MKRINPEILEKQKEINQDAYGGACVAVAENVLSFLDDFEGEFNIGYHPDMTTPHGIICHCDDQGGITGFMAGAVQSIVAQCHVLGWKFWLAGTIDPYSCDDKEQVARRIGKVVEAECIDVSREDAEKFVEGLIERHKAKEAK